MRGIIFDIQRFSTHDGPGIRTTVFFKGCPLRCFWCHNPESISPAPEVLFTREKCIGCGGCTGACPARAIENGQIDRTRCTGCGGCAAVCPSRALKLYGREVTARDVLREAERDMPFYARSGGGVTLSGGEALMQGEFAGEVLRLLRERGIRTAVDTAGDVPYSAFERVAGAADLFLFDIKTAEGWRHERGCGRGNARILGNLHRLCQTGANIRLRVPVIPGFNDSAEAMRAIGGVIGGLPGRYPLDLLRFHRMGAQKYAALGIAYRAEESAPPDDEAMRGFAKELRPYCAEAMIL